MDSQSTSREASSRPLRVEKPVARAWKVEVLVPFDLAPVEIHHLAVFEDGDHDAAAHELASVTP